MNTTIISRRKLLSDIAILIYLAVAKLALHMLFHADYGYFRDEFYYIACSDHLAWGYVDQPPLSIFILAVGRALMGSSLFSMRLLTALAGSGVVFMTGMMVRRLGGGRFAQVLAAVAVIASPIMLALSRFFSMNAFDILFWTLAAYLVILIMSGEHSKHWLTFGLIVGLGLLNKYSIGFFCIGLFAGLLLTIHRRQFLDKWFWFGTLIALGIFLPHILWQVVHGFPSVEFMRNAAMYKNLPTPPLDFLTGQFLEAGFANALLWVPGLLFCFFHREGKRYRLFGWMYVVIFAVMVATNAKVYYLSPIYPAFLALGSVAVCKFIERIGWSLLKPAVLILVILSGIMTVPFAIPVLSVEKFIAYQEFLGLTPPQEERNEVGVLPQHYADMFGWEEMVEIVAGVYRDLTSEEQSRCVIFVRNYGEAGAIDFFGREYALPNATCGHNNYWLWGPPKDRTGDVAIMFGESHDVQRSYDDLIQYFEEVVHAATFTCTYCMPYENNRPIYICRNMYRTMQEIWPDVKNFN